MESTSKIIKALIAARKKITEPRKLQQANTGKYQYKFADLDEVLDCVTGPCLEHGILISQQVESDRTIAKVTTILSHESGEILTFPGLGVPVPKDDPQGVGIAIAYARRYSLLSVFCLAQVDEDGAYNRFTGKVEDPAAEKKAEDKPETAPASSEEFAPAAWIKRLEGVIKNSGRPREQVLTHFGIDSLEGLTKTDCQLINKWVVENDQVPA